MDSIVTGVPTSVFAQLFEQAATGMALVRADGECVSANRASLLLLGRSAEELRGSDLRRLFRLTDADSLDQWGRLLGGELTSFCAERRVHRPDGGMPWIELTLSRVAGAADDGAWLAIQLQEISRRKRAELERDAFFDMSVDLLAVGSVEGYLEQVNRAWTECLGWQRAELTSRPFLDFVHPDDRAPIVAAVRRDHPGPRVRNLLSRFRTVAGDYRWLEWSTRAAEGRLFGVARDVTERRLREQALRESDARARAASEQLSAVVQGCPVGIIVHDADGRVLLWNPAAAAIFGWSEQEVLGRPVPMVGDADWAEFLEQSSRLLAGERLERVRARRYHRSGRPLEIVFSAAALGEQSGQPAAVIRLLEDVTEQERLARAGKLEGALRDALLAALADMGEAIAVVEESRVVYCNKAVAKLVGLTPEQLQSLPRFSALFSADQRERVRRNYARRAAGKYVPSRYQTTLRHSSGRSVDVDMAVTMLEFDGRRAAVLAMRDISDQKAIEQQLQSDRSQLEEKVVERTAHLQAALRKVTSLVDHSPLAVLELDRGLRIRRWSQRAAELFGWSAAEAIGGSLIELGLVHEADRDAVDDLVVRLLSGRERSNSGTSRNYTRDRRMLHCEWYNSALVDDDGQIASILCLGQDATARRVAEAAVKEREGRFRSTFEQAAVGIAHVAPDGRWLRVNQKLCEILGYPLWELLERHFQQFTHPDDLAHSLELLEQVLSGRLATFTMEKRYLRKGGGSVWAQLTVSARRDAAGAPLHLIAVIEDISVRKAAEASLAQARDLLEQRVAERTRELAAVNDALRASERHIREIAATVPGVLYQWYRRADGSNGFYYISPRASDLLGIDPAAARSDWIRLIHPDDRQSVLRAVCEVVQRPADWAFECRLLAADGSVRWGRVAARLARADAHEQVYNGFIIDVTEAHQAKQALAENEQRYRALIEGSVQGIVVERVQDNFRPLFLNDAAARLFGYDSAAALLREESVVHLMPEQTRQSALRVWPKLVAGELEHIHSRVQQLRRDGSVFWSEVVARVVDWEGEPALQLTMVDVTERQESEAELERLATTDPLTGVFNRHQFNALIAQEVRRSQRHPQPLTLLMLDVDRFKQINDRFGHGGGDAVLRALTEVMRQVLRESDVIARMGGEEFAALLLNADLRAGAEVAERLRLACEALTVSYRGQQIRITVSIGLSQWQPGESDAEEALRRADKALYAAKHGGRNRVMPGSE